jgi:class 3 adenylate cyclase/tetratricopeptide (TPR) repeat protein
MSFLDTIERAKAFLERNRRVSLSALRLEFDLDDARLESLIEELVDVQQVAACEGKVLSWIGSATALPTAEAEAAPITASEATAARSPAEAERRQLTVMFCDLVGSTDLSQRLDAEELREVVRAYQESASAVIERYEGHVAQYLGDGLLVYFGYPQAHEDDAERAVRAGREILTALGTLNETLEPQHGVRLAARVGIHTGTVVVGEMGGGAKSETLALGDTTNIAARLEGTAEADSVLISGATLRLVPGIFATKDLGTPMLKGIADPIRAYAVLQATGVRSRLDVDPSKLTPLVGRDQEVGLLLERWEQVGEGEGQTVLLSGDAGLGKSRLLQAFRERLSETPHGWLECRCSPYTQGSAFHPLIELMEQGLGIQAGDDPETKLARLEAGVAAAGLSVPEVVPLLAPLLSLSLPDRYPPLQFSPELQRKKTIEALVAWTFGLAESQPVVLLVEDLHWCDASTVELLGWLLEQSPTVKVLTLLSFRPDFEPPWPARSHITPLAVKRLSRRQATNLIGGMTRDVLLPGAVVERVVERADGVPLFVEELTKMVLESDLVEEREGRYELTGPIAEVAIPTTLQDSLMARLDRLDEGKAVAQLAATLGREFSYELLRSVSLEEEPRVRNGLAQLVDAELLYQRGALPEALFSFKHALIQETAYQSLLRSVRQQYHARIAKVLDEQFPDRAWSEPEVVARHYDEAGLAEPAIAHYRWAGQRAMERTANEEAIGHLRRALDLLATLPACRDRDQRELGLQMAIGTPLGAARGLAHRDCQAAYERARQLADQIGDAPELPRVLAGLCLSYFTKGEGAIARELAEQSLSAAERMGDPSDLSYAHVVVGVSLYSHGEFSGARQHLEQTSRLDDASPRVSFVDAGTVVDLGAGARSFRAFCHWALGQPDRARALSREAALLAQRRKDVNSEALSLLNESELHALRREFALTRERAEEVISLSEKVGFPLYSGVGRIHRGWAVARLGEGEQGVAEMQQGVAEAARIGTGWGAPKVLAMYAEAFWTVGRHDKALGALETGVALAEQQAEYRWNAELRRLRGEILLDQGEGRAEEAEGLFHEALEIARRQEAKGWELRAATSLARLWQRQGKRAEARDLLQPVYAWFTEGFDTQDLKDAKALLAELA